MTFKGPTDLSWAALFEAQVQESSKLFFHLASGILRHGGDAEEICQEAFLRAWERRHTLLLPSELKSWLKITVVNESLLLLRRKKIELRVLTNQAKVTSESYEDPKDFDRHESIVLAMEKLPELQRDIVTLRLLRGLSGIQTGRLLGCSPVDVSRQFHQGLERLRTVLPDWAHDSTSS